MRAEHRPTPEFQGHLEWQIATELRRRERFGGEATTTAMPTSNLSTRSSRWLQNAALIMIWIFVGAGGTIAAEHLQLSRRAELLLEEARVRSQLADARLTEATSEHERFERLHAEGVVDASSILQARERLDRARSDALRVRLEIEEIELSQRPVRRDVSAPLIAGRDFVSEAWQIELQATQEQLQSSQQSLDRLKMLHANGAVPAGPLREGELAVTIAAVSVSEVQTKLAIREQFRAGTLTAAESERTLLRQSAEYSQERIQRELAAAQRRLEVVRAQRDQGVVPNSELRRAQSRVRELEGELRIAELRLRLAETPEDAPRSD